MSVEFFGIGGLGQIGSIKKGEKAQTEKKTGPMQEGDQVQFSSVLQDVHKMQAGGDNSGRAEKVAELKAQISNGSYEPDLNKVASNLLQFLMETK
ncbi:MAG: flagellar biosynthesis anti-sigma factor FlgM [Proteobacteria bacterium]|nr:flagellar biosynthesis anti-sigma factor FlgM [Pseudomonadota bacterium]MBU1059915.1 flagellar biosynthesis anti-sigma factor FlgM [Pseudomonadota bacterium]